MRKVLNVDDRNDECFLRLQDAVGSVPHLRTMWWWEVILALASLVIGGGSAFGDDRRPTTSSLLKQLSSKNPVKRRYD